MKKLSKLMLFALSVFIMASCSDDDPSNTSKVGIKFKKSETALKATTPNEEITFTKFELSIGEIEFDIKDDVDTKDVKHPVDGSDLVDKPVHSDVDLKGPFLIDVLVPSTWNITTSNVPNGDYEDIEFDFEPYTKKDEAGKDVQVPSIHVEGKCNGKAFIISTEKHFEIEVEFADKTGKAIDYTVSADANLWIDCNLLKIKDLVQTIDWGAAVPTNGVFIFDDSKDNVNAPILAKWLETLEDAFEVEDNDDEEPAK